MTHRFSGVRMADRIVVLKDGAVDAMGTHAELLAQGGRYAELFELQAAGYRSRRPRGRSAKCLAMRTACVYPCTAGSSSENAGRSLLLSRHSSGRRLPP
jgi:hypothetical protein